MFFSQFIELIVKKKQDLLHNTYLSRVLPTKVKSGLQKSIGLQSNNAYLNFWYYRHNEAVFYSYASPLPESSPPFPSLAFRLDLEIKARTLDGVAMPQSMCLFGLDMPLQLDAASSIRKISGSWQFLVIPSRESLLGVLFPKSYLLFL